LLEYFWKAYNDETGQHMAEMPGNITPDFVFDVLETPLRDISGDIIQERSADGHMVAARRFPPNSTKHSCTAARSAVLAPRPLWWMVSGP
jgi:hypothetical protein